MNNSNALEEIKNNIHELAVEYFKLVHAKRLDKEIAKGSKKFVTIIENTEKPIMLIIVESEL